MLITQACDVIIWFQYDCIAYYTIVLLHDPMVLQKCNMTIWCRSIWDFKIQRHCHALKPKSARWTVYATKMERSSAGQQRSEHISWNKAARTYFPRQKNRCGASVPSFLQLQWYEEFKKDRSRSCGRKELARDLHTTFALVISKAQLGEIQRHLCVIIYGNRDSLANVMEGEWI